MPRLPKAIRRLSSADVPTVRPPSDPGVRVPQTGVAEGEALEGLGNKILNIGQNQLKKQISQQALEQERNDKIGEVQSVRLYNQAINEEALKIKETEDISLPETQEKLRGMSSIKKGEILGNYKGSNVGRDNLEFKLDQLRFKFDDQVGADGRQRQQVILGDQIDEDIGVQVGEAAADPSRLPEALDNIDRIILDNSNIMQPGSEEKFQNEGRKKLFNAVLNTNFFKGQLDDIEDIISDPRARQALGAEGIEAVRKRLKKHRDSESDNPDFAEKVDRINATLPDGQKLSRTEMLQLESIKADVQKSNSVSETVDKIEAAEEFLGEEIPAGKKKEAIFAAAGIQKDAAAEGRRLSDVEAAKTAQDKVNGLMPAKASDLVDESGNVKNEVSNTARSLIVDALGGAINPATGDTNLDDEVSKLLPGFLAEVEKEIKGGSSVGEAVEIVMAENKNIPEPKTFLNVADDIIAEGSDKISPQDNARVAKEFDKIDLDTATGLGSKVTDFWNRTAGQVSDFVDVDNVEARNKLKRLQHNLIINNKRSEGRVPVYEQERLERIFPGPGVLNPGEVMRTELRVYDSDLAEEIRFNRKMLTVGKLDAAGKQEIVRNIRTMVETRKSIAEFDLTPGGKDGLQLNTVADVDKATDAQLKKWQRSTSTSAQQALPDEVIDKVFDRLNGDTTEGEAPAPQVVPQNAPKAPKADANKITALDDATLQQAIDQAREQKHPFLEVLEAEQKSRSGTPDAQITIKKGGN